MKKSRRAKKEFPRFHQFNERAYNPYALAIGRFSLAWNDLHERLAFIFVNICDTPDLPLVSKYVAIWASVSFDRPKRKMLSAAINAPITQFEMKRFPKFLTEMNWLLGEVESLEDARNNIVHAPLVWIEDVHERRLMGFGDSEIAPSLLWGNERAARLARKAAGKTILQEIAWTYETVIVLRDYAVSLSDATRHAGVPWPRRPALPNRGARKTPRKTLG